jgi:tripartite-type tricarboxylate transporter receptor subunit TctC
MSTCNKYYFLNLSINFFKRKLQSTIYLVTLAFISSFAIQATAQNAAAEKWPTRPIKMIVPFAAGGPLDLMARKVALKLGDSLGVSVIVDNRAGANGIIGSDLVAKSATDGYTMLFMTGSFSANPVLYKKLPYDPMKDFAPITLVARSYGLVLVVNNDSAANSLKEIITLAQEKPGKLNYASGGQGNLTHLAAALFEHLTNIQLTHIPYKGSGPAIADVLAKQVDMTFLSTVAATQLFKEKRLKAIAISSSVRCPALPNVPTFSELGIKGMEPIFGYYGMWFPAGTAVDKIDKVQQAIAKSLQAPDMKEQLDELGLISIASTPAEFSKFITEDIAYQSKIFKIAKIDPQ